MAKKKKLERGQHGILAEYVGKKPATIRRYYIQHKLDAYINNGKYDLEAVKDALPKIINRKYQAIREKQWEEKPAYKPPPTDEASVKSYLDETIGDLSELDLNELQKRNELEKLLMSRIKRQVAEGDLVNLEQVKQEVFNAFRILRDSILNLPDRESANLMTIKDEKDFRRKFTTILRQPLEEIQKFKYVE